METLESRLQKRIYVSLYALFFLITLLGLSVLLEGCADNGRVVKKHAFEAPSFRGEMRAGGVNTHAQSISPTRNSFLIPQLLTPRGPALAPGLAAYSGRFLHQPSPGTSPSRWHRPSFAGDL